MTPPLLFVIGDSISIQYGSALEAALAGHFRYDRKGGSETRDSSQAAVNDGGSSTEPAYLIVNGGDSSKVLEYLRRKLAAGFTCDWLLLNCGLHDIKCDPATKTLQVPPETYRENLCGILNCLREISIRPLWVRTTPVDDAQHWRCTQEFIRRDADVEAYNASADEIFSAADVPIIDLYTFTKNLDEELYCDHVHFSEPVRKLQGAFIAGQVLGLTDSARHARLNNNENNRE